MLPILLFLLHLCLLRGCQFSQCVRLRFNVCSGLSELGPQRSSKFESIYSRDLFCCWVPKNDTQYTQILVPGFFLSGHPIFIFLQLGSRGWYGRDLHAVHPVVADIVLLATKRYCVSPLPRNETMETAILLLIRTTFILKSKISRLECHWNVYAWSLLLVESCALCSS